MWWLSSRTSPGSIGTAVLSSFAASAASDYLAGRAPSPELGMLAALESYHTVFWWSAGFLILCAVVSAVVFRSGPLKVDPDAARALSH